MLTSASERLELLFAGKQRPVRPEPAKPEKEVSHNAVVENNSEVLVGTQNCSTDAMRIGQLPDHGIPKDSDSGDDEYATAFSKPPEMKNVSTRALSKDGLSGLDPPTSDCGGVAGHIEYIPDGKRSVSQTYPENEKIADKKERATSYSGNGHTLLGQYCVFTLLAKFPYKYMKDPDDRVSRQFFASNRFYDRKWTLYYIYPPQSFARGALLLVPLAEAQRLINEISSAFKIEMSVPPPPFTLEFYDDGTPQPTFLGTSESRQEVNDWTQQIPDAQPGHGECPPMSSADVCRAYEAYKDKVETAALANRSKNTGSRQRKTKNLSQILQDSHNQLKRAERYFGLRPCTAPAKSLPNLSWDDSELHKRDQQKSRGLFINFHDPDEPAPHPFECEPIIIAIDVESFERNHGFVTEIGISTLDTLDLAGVSPGVAGENWMKHIRSRHFRIRGREHLINTEFCIGNPDAFNFGKSEFVSLHKVPDAIDSCFEWPFSVNFKRQELVSISNQDTTAPVTDTGESVEVQKGPKERNLVLLGHDIGADLDYLRNLGSAIFNPTPRSTSDPQVGPLKSNRHLILTSILETLDTATLYQAYKNEPQTRSLGHICTTLGIDTWSLHNAGNDARYTLEALVKLVIAARVDEDEQQRLRDPTSTGVIEDKWEAENSHRVDERIEAARANLEKKLTAAAQNLDPSTTDTTTPPESLSPAGAVGIHADANDTGTDDGEIDWSIPLQGEKTSTKRKKKHKHQPSPASLPVINE